MRTNKYISLILGFWLLLPAVVTSQDFWEQLYFPDTARVRCIKTNNDGDIFVGTGNATTIGGIYRSTDNAQSWEFVYNLGDFSILSMDISPQGDVFAGSNKGWNEKLLKSSDNGDTWQEIILPDYSVAENVIKILAVSTDTIYVSTVNNNALLLRTYDGGQTWDSLVGGNSHPGEYISDILIVDDGTIFVSYKGWYLNQGGVFYSEDDGETWELSGMFKYFFTSLASNNSGDIFAGCWGGYTWDEYPGLYVLRDGETDWDTLIVGPLVGDVTINSENHIFFTSQWPLGVSRSIDNGESFELINEGLPPGYHNNIVLDNYEHLYTTSGDNLSKSINPTVSIIDFSETNFTYNVFPNPTVSSFEIFIKTEGKSPQLDIRLIDLNGKILFNKQITAVNEPINVNVSKFNRGLYILEIQYNNKLIHSKVIKN